ncbi:hypothetical protein OC845_000327 [Tilletia horrida]|nr:hypothetical protein OC845_000327 [Tilletia horrida]
MASFGTLSSGSGQALLAGNVPAGAATAGSSASASAGIGSNNGAGPSNLSAAALQLEAPEGAWLLSASLPPPQPLSLSNNISIASTTPLPHYLLPRFSSALPAFEQHDPDFDDEGSLGRAPSQTQERAKKLPRPRQNVKSTSSTFINRVQGHAELTKVLASRSESDAYYFLNIGRTFVWLADTVGKVKEPLMRITFTAPPACHDVNPYTRSNDRLDVIIGFANTGDLLWLCPISSKYTRINKGGVVTSSGVTQVKWLPPAMGSDLLFMATHADGTVIMYDATRDDPQQGQFAPGVWTTDGNVTTLAHSGGLKGTKSTKERKFRKKDKEKDKGRPSTASSSFSMSGTGFMNGAQAMAPQMSSTSNNLTTEEAEEDTQEVLDNASVSTGDGQAFGSHRRANNLSSVSSVSATGTISGSASPYVPEVSNGTASTSSLSSAAGKSPDDAARRRRLSASSFLDNPLISFTGSGSVPSNSQQNGVAVNDARHGTETIPWDESKCIIVTRPGYGSFSSPRGNESIGAPNLLPNMDVVRIASPDEEGSGWTGKGTATKSRDASWSKFNPVTHWRISKKRLTDFAFSPDLLHAAFTCDDGQLRVIDVGSERLLDTFQGYFGGLTCVCWSPDGKFLLTGGQDDLITVWAPREGRIIARCQGHSSFVTSIGFDLWRWRPEERSYRFASVGEDCKIIFWDFSSAALKRPKGHHTSHSGSAAKRSMIASTLSLLDRHGGHRNSNAGPRGSINMDRHALGLQAPALIDPAVHSVLPRSEVAMLQPVVVQQISGLPAPKPTGPLTPGVNQLSGSMPASYASTNSSGTNSAQMTGSTTSSNDILVAVQFDSKQVLIVRKNGQVDSYARPSVRS